jgi:hypothetical protein
MAYNLGSQVFQQWQVNHPGPMGNFTVIDSVPEEMRYLVDPHWYQFPPMNPLWHVRIHFFIEFSLLKFLTNEFLTVTSRLCNCRFRYHRDARQLVRYLHLHQDQITPNSLEHVCCQSRFL